MLAWPCLWTGANHAAIRASSSFAQDRWTGAPGSVFGPAAGQRFILTKKGFRKRKPFFFIEVCRDREKEECDDPFPDEGVGAQSSSCYAWSWVSRLRSS